MQIVDRTLQLFRTVCSTACVWRILYIATVLLVVAGCSTRFIYNQLDSFIVWKVDDYVPLTSPQKAELKLQVSEQLEAARQDDLPRLAALLDEFAEEVESGAVTQASLDEGFVQMIALIDESMLGIVPVAEWLLLDLSEEQVAEMFENFEELN
jgi:hypothetical protein